MRFIRMMKGNTGTTEKNVGGSNRPFFCPQKMKKGPQGPFSLICPVLNKVYTSHPDFPES